MNSIFKKYTWLKYVLGGFIVALGVLVIILACLSVSQLPMILNITLSVGTLLFGLFLLFHALFNETHKLFTITFFVSGLVLALGMLFLISRFYLKFTLREDLIIYLSALTVLTLGAIAIFKGTALIVYHEKTINVVIMYSLGTAGVVAGILALCFVDKLHTVSYILLGITLLIIGILMITLSLIAQNKRERE